MTSPTNTRNTILAIAAAAAIAVGGVATGFIISDSQSAEVAPAASTMQNTQPVTGEQLLGPTHSVPESASGIQFFEVPSAREDAPAPAARPQVAPAPETKSPVIPPAPGNPPAPEVPPSVPPADTRPDCATTSPPTCVVDPVRPPKPRPGVPPVVIFPDKAPVNEPVKPPYTVPPRPPLPPVHTSPSSGSGPIIRDHRTPAVPDASCIIILSC